MPEETSAPRSVTIDLDSTIVAAQKGIRRAYVFMGLGVNAAADPNLNNVHLADNPQIFIVPQEVPPEIMSSYKESFAQWIISNGLREIIESFGLTLNSIYRACLLIDAKGQADVEGRNRDRAVKFEQLGEKRKLENLADEFGITSELADYIQLLNAARNCLTHRWGVVSQADCNEPGEFVLRWRRLEYIAQTEGGHEIVLPARIDEPIHFDEPATIGIRWVDANRSFVIVSVLRLEPQELLDICLMMLMATDELRRSLLSFVESRGIQVNVRDQPAPAEAAKPMET